MNIFYFSDYVKIEQCYTVCKVVGAGLAMVSLVEFVWYATTRSDDIVVDKMVSAEQTADQPMPVDIMAALVQLMTFVSY